VTSAYPSKVIEERFGSSIEISTIWELTNSDVHPLVKNISNREETVIGFIKIIKSKFWLSITGSISTGKTQLAILISEKYNMPKYWIGLRGFDNKNYFLKIIYV